MPEQPTPTPVAPPPEEAQRADPLASAVAEAVGKLRRSAGLSERAAARPLGTSQPQLWRREDPRPSVGERGRQRARLRLGRATRREEDDRRLGPEKRARPVREIGT